MKMWLRLGLDRKRNPGWKCGMRIADTGMRIADSRMWVADSGMWIAENAKSGPVIIWDLSTPENTVDTAGVTGGKEPSGNLRMGFWTLPERNPSLRVLKSAELTRP